MSLIEKLRTLPQLPFPGGGYTSVRHHALIEIARNDLSLARLAEAHFDAVAILAEADRLPERDAIYGVWASEIPGQAVTVRDNKLYGRKRFCTGAGLLDHALVTVTEPESLLIDLNLRDASETLTVDDQEWITTAFADTSTATVTFDGTPVQTDGIIGTAGSYLERPGFWNGAIGPAACWAGGAIGLVDWARQQKRNDPHTLAHLGALEADAWHLRSTLERAGREIDTDPSDAFMSRRLALIVRHLIETTCADILTRLGRAYGPHPLAFDPVISRRLGEVELYIRQCHAERDLQSLGNMIWSQR